MLRPNARKKNNNIILRTGFKWKSQNKDFSVQPKTNFDTLV